MTSKFWLLDAQNAPPAADWASLAREPAVIERRRALEAPRMPTTLQDPRMGALRYQASEPLVAAINTALALEMPLLLSGKPGVGKTQVAWFVAAMFGLDPPYRLDVGSTTTKRDLLYTYDAVGDFRDAHERDGARDRTRHIRPGPLWRSIRSEVPCVVLVDEIDKAPRDFPNDLLGVLSDFEFEVPELERFEDGAIRARFPELVRDATGAVRLRGKTERRRPFVVVTTNSERRLPEPFLRRCIFHIIELDRELVRRAYEARKHDPEFAGLAAPVVDGAITAFLALADNEALRKPPSLAEFLGWLRLLALDVAAWGRLADPLHRLPYLSALIKVEEDFAALAP